MFIVAYTLNTQSFRELVIADVRHKSYNTTFGLVCPDGLAAPERPLATTEWKRQQQEAPCGPERFDVHMMTTLLKTGAELDIAK